MDPIDLVAERIRGAQRVVYLCGAGLSVASGVRPYRSGPNALWDEYVLEWGTREKLLANPAAWWSTFWLGAHAEVLKKDLQTNAGHVALARLMARANDDLTITQNIDCLHRAAGHPEAQLVEIHGRHDRFFCSAGCDKGEAPVGSIDLSRLDSGVVPRCPHCDAPMRPLVLLFDELYDCHPAYQARRARRALDAAEVVVFVGTSFSVGITESARRSAEYSGALMVNVNPEPAPLRHVTELRGPAELVLPELAWRVLAAR